MIPSYPAVLFLKGRVSKGTQGFPYDPILSCCIIFEGKGFEGKPTVSLVNMHILYLS